MPRIIVTKTTIDINDAGPAVEVGVVVGFAKLSETKLTLLKTAGDPVLMAKNPKKNTLHPAGKPSVLLGGNEISFSGNVARASTTEDATFQVSMSFFQGNKHVGSAKPVAGKFKADEVLAAFVMTCNFN